MRIAILADIHANALALEAVVADLELTQPDRVIVAGDFQNRGPFPREVTYRLYALGWALLRGNHEDYVIIQSTPVGGVDLIDSYSWQPARWTAQQVAETVPHLKSLPIAIAAEGPDGSQVCVAHGSPRSNAEGFFPSTTPEKAKEMLGVTPPQVLCCGHTHIPLSRQIDGTFVFNVGSVGFPFDGDPRAAYGLLCWSDGRWTAELRRVEYPVADVVSALSEKEFHEGTGPLGRIIQRELETARPHLTLFTTVFLPRVRVGEIDITEAVTEYLHYPQAEIETWYAELRTRQKLARSSLMTNDK
ncbi:MAG: metallophosphoesterase family protein [Verrucomicrobia bacterium]|nr:metallophosphoesterase family protein [Verrucomicrobiota bacterium]